MGIRVVRVVSPFSLMHDRTVGTSTGRGRVLLVWRGNASRGKYRYVQVWCAGGSSRRSSGYRMTRSGEERGIMLKVLVDDSGCGMRDA